MNIKGILETALYVDDLEKAEEFYSKVLNLKLHSKKDGRHLFFKCGDKMLLIFNPDQSLIKTGPVPTHGAKGPGHVAFEIDKDQFEESKKNLIDNNVNIETEVDWEKGKSIYFRDPSGNSLELTTPHIWTLE